MLARSPQSKRVHPDLTCISSDLAVSPVSQSPKTGGMGAMTMMMRKKKMKKKRGDRNWRIRLIQQGNKRKNTCGRGIVLHKYKTKAPAVGGIGFIQENKEG